jgi:hypothetical protein
MHEALVQRVGRRTLSSSATASASLTGLPSRSYLYSLMPMISAFATTAPILPGVEERCPPRKPAARSGAHMIRHERTAAPGSSADSAAASSTSKVTTRLGRSPVSYVLYCALIPGNARSPRLPTKLPNCLPQPSHGGVRSNQPLALLRVPANSERL